MTEQMTLTTMDLIEKKISETLKKVKDGLPHTAGKNGIYDATKPSWWTSGFWPGILWNLYDQTGKEEYRNTALSASQEIASYFRENQDKFDHDVGFQFLLTAVYHYEITGDEKSKRIGIEAANFLAGRFNPIGRYIKSWDRASGWVIVDCLMNLSLLFWASRVTGDPRYKHIAIHHADTFLKYGVREDGSTCHILSFDPETGEFIEALGGQGFSSDSSWSRGNAWAIYGYANMYRFTGDEKYLQASKKIAHQFLASLPEDFVPYWDHRASSIETEPRDSSAAAITASGLIELANHVPQNEKRIYLNAAKKIVISLSENYSTWDQPDHQAVLIEGTGHRPKGNFVNASLIYGDYYYIEAISKLNGYNKYIF